jgi:predicted RNA-binding protein with PUA-like domain
MPNWLLKTEPKTYSYARLETEKKTVWDGVTNPMALKNVRAVKKGDRVVVYHTGDEKSAVGLAEIASDAYEDPNDPKLAVFSLVPKKRLAEPVPLANIKASALFVDSPLVRQGRLSVVALDERQYKWLVQQGKKKA